MKPFFPETLEAERRRAEHQMAVHVRKPLLTIPTVAAAVGAECAWGHILKAVDAGRIAWAWRINSAGSTRSEVRVLRHSAEHFARTLGLLPEPALAWEDVLAAALPPGDAFPSVRLMCWWSAGPELGRLLTAEGSLRGVAGETSRRGRGNSLLITRESAEEFLRSRRIA